jgi:hypothetical protein
MVTLKLRLAGGGDRSGAATAVPLDGSTATVGTSCPLVVSCPISSSTIRLVHLGVGELPTRVKNKREFQPKKHPSESRKSTRTAMTSTHQDVPISPLADEALALRFRVVTLGPRGWLGKRSPPGKLTLS